MTEVIGKPLRQAVDIIMTESDKIIEIVKLKGTNKRFNNLSNPYIVKVVEKENYIKLFVAYY